MSTHSHPDNTNSGFLIGAVVGGVLGAVSVMLFTTKHGERMREEAVDKYHEVEAIAKKFIKAKIKKHRRRR